MAYKMLEKKAVEELNDINNNDEAHSNVGHFTSHPLSYDCNKASFNNTTPRLPNWLKRQNDNIKTNNISYDGDVMQYLLILVFFLKQFVHYQQRQTTSEAMIYRKYTSCLTVASVCFDDLCITPKLVDVIQQWKILCYVIIQYWKDLLDIYQYLGELVDDMVEQWKEVPQTVAGQCLQCLCSITSSPIMPKQFNLTCFSPLPIYLNWLDDLSHDVTLQAAMFGDQLSNNVALLFYDVVPTRLTPSLFVSVFSSFPCYHKWLCSCGCNGRQASDRSSNSKQTHSESSSRSGSAGSSTSSSTTGGMDCGGFRRGGKLRNSGSGSGGDDEDENNGRNWDRKLTYAYSSPPALEWEEDDDDKPFLAATASYNASGKRKETKTAEPIAFEMNMKGSNGLDMFTVSSPMMNGPLLADDSEQLYPPAPAPSKESIPDRNFCESYHDKLLYSDDIRRSYQSLKNLCLPCELAIAQAPPHSSRTIAVSLLPPPGGGNDIQFKETLMVLCTVIATVYCYFYGHNCYFECGDLNIQNVCEERDEDTGKITAINLHSKLHQLEEDHDKIGATIVDLSDVSKDIVRADINKGLVSLANDIYSPYQQTMYWNSVKEILTIINHYPPHEEDLDVLHALLVYHDNCVPFTNTAINFVLLRT